MTKHWPSRKTRRNNKEAGLTFVEVIISVVILTMITGALSMAFVASLKASNVSRERVHESNDAQLIAAYFTRDAQAVGGGPGTDAPSASSAISTTDAAGCTVTGGTLIVRFEWIDPSTNTTHIATYYTQPLATTPGANQLIRLTCVAPSGGSPTTSSLTLANRVTASPAPVAWCDNNAPGSCPITFPITLPNTVSMRITELNTPVVLNTSNPGVTDSFTLTANVRPQNPTFDGAIPTPLVILGRPGVCGGSDGTTGLGVLLGTLNVYGRAYVNAHDNGGTCSAMSLAVAGSYQGGITSLVSGGNCSVNFQLWAQPCATAPFLTTNNPPIDNPYANLPPMTPAVMATLGPGGTPLTAKSGCSGPGIYAATLSITSSCTLLPGVYVLHNGISITNFANLTGNGVLLYIDHGGFNANGAGQISLTGLAGNTAATAPYAGLVIWKSDSSTVTCSGFGTSSQAGVCLQGSFFSGASLQGVVYAPQSSVVNQLAILSTASFKGIVAQAVVVSEGLGGTTSIGTPSLIQPSITTASLPSGTVNRPYPSTTLAATGGTAPYWWQTTGNTSLPAGLTLDGSTGTISGTPTATGTTTVKISATDILGQTVTKTFNITINLAPAITTTPPDWTVGFIYDNFPMQASGGTTPFTWTATGLPTGLSINAVSGVISGKPTTVGASNATVTVTDAAGASSNSSYTMHINLAPTINGPATLPSPWTQGSPYPSTTITTANGTAPFTWAASGLPPGLSLNANGQIIGTPTVAGTYSSVTVTATDTAGAAATQTYSIVVNPPLGLGGSLPNGEINRPYSYTVVPTGGTPPFTFSITGGALPAGLTMSAAGVISGTPTAVGALSVTIQVKDSTKATTSKTYTLTIVAAPTITGPALSDWTINRNYPGTQMMASGGIAPLTYSATGLPTGLGITSGGLITGKPTATGTYSSVVVTLTDATGFQTTKSYTVNINGPPSITTGSLPPGETTVAYSQPMASSGGTAPLQWTTSGPMPPGLGINLNTGVISGTPTASGVFSLSITVTDTAGASASQTLTLTIAQGPGNGTVSLPNGEVSIAYPNTTVTANGGTPPYTFTATGMPPGLGIDLNSGVISGSPTTAGTYSNVQITIHDSVGGAVTTTYTIVIAAAPSITTASLPNAPVNQPYPNTTVAGSGGTTPYAWSATGLPTGLTINAASGVISGTPTVTGTYSSVVVKLTDNVGTSVTKTFSITISPPPTVTSVSPTSRGQGAQNQTITINGTGFVNGASLTAVFSNPGIIVVSTTFVNAGQITAKINVSGAAATGAGTVTMTNGDGGAATNSVAFTVNTGPTITTVNPTTHSCFFFGCSGFVVTITGTGFVTGSTTVALNATSGTGPTITNTAWTGTTQIKITINIPGFVTSTDNVVVTNPDGGQVTKIGGFATT